MLSSDIQVWVAAQKTDMRKGCFSLAALVQQEFELDPEGSTQKYLSKALKES